MDLKKYNILNTCEKVPSLKEVLDIVDGKVTLLIEVKGFFSNVFKEKLIQLLSHYKGKIYFHAKNLITFLD